MLRPVKHRRRGLDLAPLAGINDPPALELAWNDAPADIIRAGLHLFRVLDLSRAVPGLPPFWGADHFGNEQQRYQPDAMEATSQLVRLTASKSPTKTGPQQFRSGACTFGFDGTGVAHLGDYIEGEMRCDREVGVWPALWMMPQADPAGGPSSSPEIDIVECIGEQPNASEHHVHYDQVDIPGHFTVRLDWSQWHRYGVWLTPSRVEYFVDGLWRGSLPASPKPLGGFGIIFNLAVGGWGGTPGATWPRVAELRRVAVWN